MNDDLNGALCAGKWLLFESLDPFEHLQAKALCRLCPVRDACQKVLDEERAKPLARYGGPTGTWAGQLINERGGDGKGRPLHAREHGTERGYQQHRHREDLPACEPCRLAHNAHTAHRFAKKAG